MTTTISPPIRILAIVGVLAALALGLLMFAHNRSSSGSGSSATPAPAATPSTSKPATAPATPAAKPAVKPKPSIVLVPSLPVPVAHSLMFSKVVVVALFSRDVPADQATLAEARAAAKAAHVGFAAVNLLNESNARRTSKLVGNALAPPVILLVKRPGKVVNQFVGTVDSDIVAQAALDAGSGR